MFGYMKGTVGSVVFGAHGTVSKEWPNLMELKMIRKVVTSQLVFPKSIPE